MLELTYHLCAPPLKHKWNEISLYTDRGIAVSAEAKATHTQTYFKKFMGVLDDSYYLTAGMQGCSQRKAAQARDENVN